MAAKTKAKKTASDQIKAALDGRSQRWLCLKIKIPEDKFSNKMTGVSEFTREELDRIGEALNITIE